MFDLDTALKIAVKVHFGQKDRYGKPYILHVLRVMSRVNTDEERLVAVLHDVIEDSSMTEQDIRKAGFSERVIDAVVALSRREGEHWNSYIERVKRNPLAVRVKLADLLDNMELSRIDKISDDSLQRLDRYLQAYHALKTASE